MLLRLWRALGYVFGKLVGSRNMLEEQESGGEGEKRARSLGYRAIQDESCF